MVLADTIVAAIGALAALATVWLAYLALGKARETVDEAKAARLDAEQAARDAAAERRAAEEDRRQAAADRREEERDRQRRRVERIGEIVEDLFWAANDDQKNTQAAISRGDISLGAASSTDAYSSWIAHRNLLRHAMVGLANQLPDTTEILNSDSAYHAFRAAGGARREVELELRRLNGEPVGMPPMPPHPRGPRPFS